MPATRIPRVFPALLLGVVLAWGSYLRLSHLELNTLASDEMNHYFVGLALERDRGPVLPSGARYTRGIEYSEMVAATLPRVQPVEKAVRLPAAVFGVACLVLFATMAWREAGPWAAVIATALFDIYPEGLRLSRFGLFYTLQLFFGLIAIFAGWRLLSDRLEPAGMNRRQLIRSWAWAILTLAAFLSAIHIQVVTLSVLAGWGVCVAGAGIGDFARHRRAAWRWSVPWQLTALGVAASMLILLSNLKGVEELIWRAGTVPMWARLSAEGGGTVTAYYRTLSNGFPLITALLPLIFIVALIKVRRLGAYLLIWFAIPLLLHSFVFPWKEDRYILLAVPALLLATGIAAAAGLAALDEYLRRALDRSWAAIAHPLAASVTGSIALIALLTLPAFNISRRSILMKESAGWAESSALIAATPSLSQLPRGTASPLPALYYWGHLDFVVQRALLESWIPDTSGSRSQPYLMNPVGSADIYAGRPTLTTPDAIRERYSHSGGVLIGIDRKYLTFRNIDPSLERVLNEEARELCRGRCGSMMLYYWEFPEVGGK
jgi:hypothetical protein